MLRVRSNGRLDGICCRACPGKDVSASALVLNLRRIWGTFGGPLNFEACGGEIPLDLVGAKEHEVDRNPTAPPLVEMNDFCSDMKGQEQPSARLQDPPELSKRGYHVSTRDMDK